VRNLISRFTLFTHNGDSRFREKLLSELIYPEFDIRKTRFSGMLRKVHRTSLRLRSKFNEVLRAYLAQIKQNFDV